MTVVLQHQFWDLTVSDEAFEVGLSFGGVPERLVVPFAAIKGFFDPSVQFGLQFEEMIEQSERFLMGTDFAQFQIRLDFTAVKLAPQLGPAGGNFLLGFLLGLLRRHCRFANPRQERADASITSPAAP